MIDLPLKTIDMDEIGYLQERINTLEDELNELKDYFDEKSEDIIRKCVRYCEKKMRKEDIPQIIDTEKYLNIFEQICCIVQEYDVDDFYGLDIYIDGTIENSLDSLSKEERYILYSGHCDNIIDKIRSEFNDYCMNYTNKNIRRELYGNYY